MIPLATSPLPSLLPKGSRVAPRDAGGFVDEAVIMALVAGSGTERRGGVATDLVLAADEDFAGWCLETASFSAPFEALSGIASAPRRPHPPELEPGLGEPHQGTHRWWLAGLAGAVCTLLVSTLLMTLAHHPDGDAPSYSAIQVPARPESAPPAANRENRAPELTATPVTAPGH